MFAISTAWNAWRYSRGNDIIREIKGLGFQYVELNFNLTHSIVKDIKRLKKQGLIDVVSVHNFCPIPKGTVRRLASPDMFSLSSLDERERKRAVHYTRQTIKTASGLGAEVVILHIGKIQNVREKVRQLSQLYRQNKKQRLKKMKEEMFEERKAKSKGFFEQAIKSLQQLTDFSRNLGINLGIENRYYFNEIPSVEEMEKILKIFPGPPIYYWHDVGHAQVYENLRFFRHETILDKFSKRMIGVHLHDIEGIDDHRAPLRGEFDFSRLLPYITEKTLKVLEPHHPATGRQIIQGKLYLERLFKNKLSDFKTKEF